MVEEFRDKLVPAEVVAPHIKDSAKIIAEGVRSGQIPVPMDLATRFVENYIILHEQSDLAPSRQNDAESQLERLLRQRHEARQRYKTKHPDEVRIYQRGLMKRKRAAQKAVSEQPIPPSQ